MFSDDESSNCVVAWVGINAFTTDAQGSSVRATYIMDKATRTWRNGPSLAGGQTVPPAAVQVVQSLIYDPFNKRTILVVGTGGIAARIQWRRAPGLREPAPSKHRLRPSAC